MRETAISSTSITAGRCVKRYGSLLLAYIHFPLTRITRCVAENAGAEHIRSHGSIVLVVGPSLIESIS
jgi:hypothetical protein